MYAPRVKKNKRTFGNNRELRFLYISWTWSAGSWNKPHFVNRRVLSPFPRLSNRKNAPAIKTAPAAKIKEHVRKISISVVFSYFFFPTYFVNSEMDHSELEANTIHVTGAKREKTRASKARFLPTNHRA